MIDIDEYLRRSGDQRVFDWPTVESPYGWFNWIEQDGAMIVGNAMGDVRALMDIARGMARERGLSPIRFGVRRGARAYQRLFNARIAGQIIEVDTWAISSSPYSGA